MKHILIADDDAGMLHLMTRALPDYRVTLARNGLEALAQASRLASCDLLITDYLMSPMLGDELAGRLRIARPSLKTLLVTGHTQFIDADECGTDAHLAKPFQVAALRAAVSALIGEA